MNRIAAGINEPRQIRAMIALMALLGLVVTLSNWILTGSSQGLVMGGMVIALVIIVVNTLNDWRTGFFFSSSGCCSKISRANIWETG